MASVQPPLTPLTSENPPPSTVEPLATSVQGAGAAHRQPISQPSSEPSQATDKPQVPECLQRSILTYTRRQLLRLHASPLVQRPQGMPALKDWFGDWSEQHAVSQTKKDGTDSNNGATGNRRFPRRDQEEGENSARPAFRSTLSQPSQMGNFKHQSLRGDLTRGDRDRDRDRDRERDNDLRDKEGHERLRSLSDMYDRDRDRMAIPLALPPSIRSQRERESAPHLSASAVGTNSSSSARSGMREGRDKPDRDKDRERDRESGRRGENRESGKRKGGESVDWRRSAEPPRSGKEDRSDARRDQEAGERRSHERERSPEVDRSRRDRSFSRERWLDRGRDRDEGRREPKGRERERDRDRDRDYHGSRAWRDKGDEDPKDSKDKDAEKGRDRGRDDDRRTRLRDLEGHTDRDRDRGASARDRWSERARDVDRGDGRGKDREDGEKETKEERRERERDRRERDREREKAREHPDAKRDRELREGWTIAEDGRHQPPPSNSGRRGPGRGDRRQGGAAGPDDERESRRDRDREKDKEPAWMDDYVPEPGSAKAGIFGGRVEGMEDEIQAWKKKQNLKSYPPNGSPAAEASSESPPGRIRDVADSSQTSVVAPSDEQAKATDAFFFGLMRSEGAKAKVDAVTHSESSRLPAPSDTNLSPEIPLRNELPLVTKQSPARGLSPDAPPTLIGKEQAKNAAILLSTLGVSPKTEATKEPSVPSSSAPVAASHTSAPDIVQPSGLHIPSAGHLGSSALADDPPPKPITSHVSAPFNPPQQSRVLAFSQSQPPSIPHLRPQVGSPNQMSSTRPSVIVSQASQQTLLPSQPNRMQPSPRLPDVSARAASLTEQATQRIQAAENMHHRSAFSPFESNPQAFSPIEPPRSSIDSAFPSSRQPSITSPVDPRSSFNDGAFSEMRNPRLSPLATLSTTNQGMSFDVSSSGQSSNPNSAASTYSSGRGSRFAKFWDGKTKEAAAAGFMQAQAAAGIMSGHSQQPPPPPQSASPSGSQPPRRSDQVSPNGYLGNAPSGDNIQDMLTMLQNSTQGNRLNASGNPMGTANHALHRQHPSNLQAMHEQVPHHQPQPQHHFSNANSLLDNQQFENRPFVPDGMVPGLRPPRSREGSGPGSLYTDTLDDSPFTVQPRLSTQQQAFEQLPARPSIPQLYSNQAPGANRNPGMFQPPYRTEPSPLGGHNPLVGGQQRLPPGLANLGGRPPHDPNGYLGGMGMSASGMHGPGVAHQQPFNNFNGGLGGSVGNVGFGGGHIPPPPQQQQQRPPLPMQTLLNNAHNALAASGHPDFTVQHHPGVRGPPPGQLLQGGVRGGFPPQGGLGGPVQHMQPPHVGVRQQQPPHLLPQMLPPHLQQQQHHQQQQQTSMHNLQGSGQNQNDHLLSMLMNGIGPRE